jgi:hypothetical protein
VKVDVRDFSAAKAAAADIEVVYYLAAQVAVISSVAQRNGSRCTVIFRVFDDVVCIVFLGKASIRWVIAGEE